MLLVSCAWALVSNSLSSVSGEESLCSKNILTLLIGLMALLGKWA